MHINTERYRVAVDLLQEDESNLTTLFDAPLAVTMALKAARPSAVILFNEGRGRQGIILTTSCSLNLSFLTSCVSIHNGAIKRSFLPLDSLNFRMIVRIRSGGRKAYI
jgi:hypothetical protein